MYKIVNKAWGYCFKWTYNECKEKLKEDTTLNEELWAIQKIEEDIQCRHINKNKSHINKKFNIQDHINNIKKRILFYSLKTKDGKVITDIKWIGNPSGFYWIFEVFTEEKSFFIKSHKFKPNADDINEYIPWYKDISRKRIK